MGRFMYALKTFFTILKDRDFFNRLEKLKNGEYPEPSQILGLFQRHGRFIDFLMEDIGDYPDAQVGGVARTVHEGCRKALKEYITIEPVMAEAEGNLVTVEKGFDASRIRLTGNVTGEPPFKGKVAHHGWKVATAKIPPLPRGHDPSIILPAEVEI
jgi:hypothetical protein